MYCKFCGNPINRETMECTKCKRKVGPLSGGNRFNELLYAAESPAQESAPADVCGKHVENTRQEKGTRQFISEAQKCSVFISALCVLICLSSFIALLSVGAKVGREADRLGERFNVMLAETNQRLDELAGSPSKPDSEPAAPAAVPGAAESDFVIEKDPESVLSVSPGTTNTAFICRAKGEGLSFSWMKYSAGDNAWFFIRQDTPGYGIVSTENESLLKVIDAGSEHGGTYICVVSDREGHTLYSAPAQLSMLPESGEKTDKTQSDTSSAAEKSSESKQEPEPSPAAGPVNDTI